MHYAPGIRKLDPLELLGMRDRHLGLTKRHFAEATARNANEIGERGEVPEQRGSAGRAEVTFLIMVLYRAEGIDSCASC